MTLGEIKLWHRLLLVHDRCTISFKVVDWVHVARLILDRGESLLTNLPWVLHRFRSELVFLFFNAHHLFLFGTVLGFWLFTNEDLVLKTHA